GARRHAEVAGREGERVRRERRRIGIAAVRHAACGGRAGAREPHHPHGSIRTMVTARGPANIALVKYWGTRGPRRHLPAAGSLSLTLAAVETITSVRFDGALADDEIAFGGAGEKRRIVEFLDLVRARAGITTRAQVASENRFPTASGLASSASG